MKTGLEKFKCSWKDRKWLSCNKTACISSVNIFIPVTIFLRLYSVAFECGLSANIFTALKHRRGYTMKKNLFIFPFKLPALIILLTVGCIAGKAQKKMAPRELDRMKFYLALSVIDKVNPDIYASGSYRFNKTVVSVENTEVSLTEYSKGEGLRFLVVHNNENTGVAAAFDFIEETGGSILKLEHGNARYINFSDSQNMYFFDPNHIFSDQGIQRDIDNFCNGFATPEVETSVRAFSNRILEEYNYDSLGYILTLHNNTDGNFNILSYSKDAFFRKAASDIHINHSMDPDDLVFVTSPCFFQFLKSKNVNVVLQSGSAPDDGSLSVFAMQKNIPYANVEVQFGHREEQLRLIKIVNEMFKDCGISVPKNEPEIVLERH